MKKYYLLLIILLPFAFFSQNFNLNSDFGDNGVVITDYVEDGDTEYSFMFNSLLKLNNEKLLLLATKNYNNTHKTFLVKYLSSGELDVNYGIDGFLELPVENNNYYSQIILQENQKTILKVLEGSYPDYTYKLLRFLPNGDLDLSFGDNGVFIPSEELGYLKIQNNKLLSFKNVLVNGENFIKIFRLLEDGTLDNYFGSNGILTTQIDANENDIINVVIHNDVIYAQVRTHSYSMEYNNYIVSINDNGSLNTDFATNGVLNYYNSTTYSNPIFNIKDNNKLIFAIKENPSYYLKQYLENGQLDMAFGDSGIATNNLDYYSELYDCYNLLKIIAKPNNEVLIIGSICGFEDSQLEISNFNNDGSLDTDFNFNFSHSYQYMDVIANQEEFFVCGSTYWYDANVKGVLEKYTSNILNTNENLIGNFNIYPNPTSKNLIIQSRLINNTPFKIVNLLGKTILKGKINTSNSVVDLSSIKSGVYFLIIDNKSYKIMKQ